MEKLIKVQQELKAPKNQFNAFGKYKYRNAEDILEAVKPLLAKYGLLMTISDVVKEVGNRIYVVSTVKISDGENEEFVDSWAREPETQKGMNESQITGAASSYARKYALNGMFCIDDTKDADSIDNSNGEQKTEKPNLILGSEGYKKVLKALIDGYSIDEVKKKYTVSKLVEDRLNDDIQVEIDKAITNGSK